MEELLKEGYYIVNMSECIFSRATFRDGIRKRYAKKKKNANDLEKETIRNDTFKKIVPRSDSFL